MAKITDIITYWSQLLLLPIYWLSFITPRNKNIWLFGSTFGKRFSDNPRYFYLYINEFKKKSKRPIWISKNKEIIEFLNKNKYEAYYYKSLKGIYYCLIGKVYIFDNYSKDINFWTSGGAVKINLWHGIPLKKIQSDNINDKVRHPKNNLEKLKYFPRRLSDEKPSHYILAASKLTRRIFKSAFRTDRVLTCGYPRNDLLLKDSEIKNIYLDYEEEQLKQISSKKGLKIILYMPTFRESESAFFDVVNLCVFEEFLEKNNMLFCVKMHIKSKLISKFNNIPYNNIFVINPDSDPYPFINLADMLVTDYSSIYFDYLFKNRPIIFFDYDREIYEKESRELYFNYDLVTPGIKAESMDSLMNALLSEDIYEKERTRIRLKIFETDSKYASQRLYMSIKRILK